MTNRTRPGYRWATRDEAADYIRVSKKTIDRWITDGKLTRYNAGHGVRLDLDELDELLRRNASGRKTNAS